MSTVASDGISQRRGSAPRRERTATLRLQLHAGYTLNDAQSDLPYFARLGVSHLYLSPVSQAVPGSTHGYDVIDHSTVDNERGGEAALRELANEAAARGMGLLLDIVPNHMATDPRNAWWADVLKHGRHSAWADWFDIDWDAPLMPGKVLAPFLEKHYADALRAGDIALRHDESEGLYIAVHGVPYPIAPDSLALTGGPQALLAAHDPALPEGRQRLHELLERQHYRLAWWRCAADIINWRRFFEVSGLIGVRVERNEVFEAVHRLPLQLYADGVVDGLRIDHVDGLALPLSYCRRLRDAMQRLRAGRASAAPDHAPWIVVEKILAHGEALDERWAVSGTSGYDFMADVGALLHDEGGEACLREGWSRIANDARPPQAWLVEARREMLERHFAAERGRLLDALMSLAQNDIATRDWTRQAIGRVLDSLLCHFPTYRSYVEDTARTSIDQEWFDRALKGAAVAAEEDDGLHAALLPVLDRWLGGTAPESESARRVLGRFQQLTPPLAAKSLEDTVFYRYGCLLSRNEVGSDPEVFAVSAAAFHAANVRRAAGAPQGLLATATHDHKRGEDVRARLAVLSEIPEEWLRLCRSWLRADADSTPVGGPGLAFRYMLMQMLVGAWPYGLSADDAPGMDEYLERIGEWAVKALREGKQHSSWFEPNPEWEAACVSWLRSMAPGGPQHSVLRQMESFVTRIEPAAIGNGLVQAALRMSCPGIPDLYQGTELRDFSLVDPDNRRPVDYEARARALAEFESQSAAPLEAGRWPLEAWSDGRVKQALIAVLMKLRRERSDAFAGSYAALDVTGARADKLLAFARADDVVVVTGIKCASELIGNGDGLPALPADYWSDATVCLPGESGEWCDVLRGRTLLAEAPRVRAADLLLGFPLAVLCRQGR